MARQINISSSLRCRPLFPIERPSLYTMYFRRNTLSFDRRLYNFEKVFDQRSKNVDIFKALVLEKIDDLLQGYNVAVMTYGPTKTGKSHTMGTFYKRQKNTKDPGIIPRTIREIYKRICKNENYSAKVSFVEVVHEEVYDLLEEPTVQRDVRETEIRVMEKLRGNEKNWKEPRGELRVRLKLKKGSLEWEDSNILCSDLISLNVGHAAAINVKL
ncbi:kinesin-like protein KIN-5A [Trichonephila clavipes]|nr:kinesin-like protein KIN-5A [Trichonephila clavipes]